MPVPAPTALTKTKRYIGAGTRRFVFVPTMANYKNATAVEITAGTELTSEIKPDGVEGFTTTSETVDAGDYGNRFTGKTAGMISVEDSSMVFYADKSGNTAVATLLPRDVAGYIVDFIAGIPASGGKMNVFPVTVTVSTATQDGAGETVGWRVGYAITDIPAENVAIPSA